MTKFLKRIGCLKTRFDFEVLLASLELPSSLAWSGTVKISLKKGKRHVETKTSHKIDHLNPSNPINESLLFPATLFLSKKTNKYLEKPVLVILDIINSSGRQLHTQAKLDFSLFCYNKEKTFSIAFEKNHIILNLTVRTLSSQDLGFSERDSDGSFISGMSAKSRDHSPHERPIRSYDIRMDHSAAINQSRHHPSEILEKPLMPPLFKTPSFNLDEGNSQFVSQSPNMLNSDKNISPGTVMSESQNEEKNGKETINKKNIKGIKIQITKTELSRILKKPATIQEEESKFKENQEALDKILNLEKTIQRKNELLEENMKKIKDLHQNEEDMKLNFYKQAKEASMKIKAMTMEIENLIEKNRQNSENLLEKQRDLQTFKEVVGLKDQEIKRMVGELGEAQEENKRLVDLNRELAEGKEGQKEFVRDFNVLNFKIKTLYEENQGLRERIEGLEMEIANLNSQKDFLFNIYEKTKEELENKEKKRKEHEEMINFLTGNNKKNEEAIVELKKELKQRVFEREEALSKQTALIIELQNLKFKVLRKNLDQTQSNELELTSTQEENAFLRKENQLLQKKLELLMQTISEEKEENSAVMRVHANQTENLKKDLELSEKRRIELETELIQMSRSSKTFLISDEFDTLKRTFDGKVKYYKEKTEGSEMKTKEIMDENEKLRFEISEKTLEIKRLQIQREDQDLFKEKPQTNEEKSCFINNEIVKEKDQIILNCHERIKDLLGENENMKGRLEEFRRLKEQKESELENEIGGLMIEVEKLGKKIKETEKEKEKLKEEMKTIKEKMKDVIKDKIELEEKARALEKERGEKEEKIGMILMKAIEVGGHELVDKLTQ